MGHIHSNGEYDFTASALIVHNEKVLLLFHANLQLWLPPAGHVELNETPIEALHREIEEETGLTKQHLTLVTPYEDNLHLIRDESVRTEPLPFDIEMHIVDTATGHCHIDLRYIFMADTGVIKREEEKAEQLNWFTIGEIEALPSLPKSVLSCAQYALDKVKES